MRDGDERFEFGNIEGIAASHDGRYVSVLDRLRHRLVALSESGAFIASAGRDGGGPGEFRYPAAVIAYDSVAIVFDASWDGCPVGWCAGMHSNCGEQRRA